VGGLKNIPVGCVFEKTFWLGGPKQEISEKVTTSQDDDFVEEVENIWLGVQKRGKIERVTGSQDDDFVRVLKKNIPNK
jgi:hypothetical protein